MVLNFFFTQKTFVRKLFSIFAKLLYQKEYLFLKSKLIEIYNPISYISERRTIYDLENMLLIGEDHRFKYHIGFDIIAIIRAMRNTFFFGKLEGASTIEQQLVRILTNQYQRTINRKVKEIFLATTIRDIIPKNHIPLMYLKLAYYGINSYGYEMISKKKNIETTKPIGISDAAEIISRIKYPESIDNSSRKLQIERRKNYLLIRFNRMKRIKLI